MASDVVFLSVEEEPVDHRLYHLICFPKPSEGELRRRLQQLLSLGITKILLDGAQRIDGLRVLGKGCDSIVVKALLNQNVVALKIRRVDSHVKTLAQEGENQRLANVVGVGARIYGFTEDFITMDLIEGLHIDKFVEVADEESIRRVVVDLLKQCRRLDLIGLDHGELSRARKHIIITSSLKPVILDFSSSSRNRRPANVSSLFSFLFLSKSGLSALLRKKLGTSFSYSEVVEALREYKKDLSDSAFAKILGFVASREIEINNLL